MSTYALIKKSKVFNVIVWDGPDVAPIEFESGVTAIEVTKDMTVGIGYIYSQEKFTAPPTTEEEQAAIDASTILANTSSKDALMNEASQRISVLQDAVDLDMATKEESTALPLWKKYRVLLSRVTANTSNEINWPSKPIF